MRKVSSAPSLVNFGNQGECPQATSSRVPKSGSLGSVSKLGAARNISKDGMKRQDSVPSRLRECRTKAFPLAAIETSFSLPPEPALTQEFAESARGLAGLECFELYGPQHKLPDPQEAATNVEDSRKQYDRATAFAACLATPSTVQEKNLGELVDAEARALLQATQQGVAKQYEREVVLPKESEISNLDATTPRRKRRLAEKGKREKLDPATLFQDCPEAQKLLSNLASLDDDNNRIVLDDNYECIGDVCFPVENVDDALFEWHPGSSHRLDSTQKPLSQSV